MMAEDSASTFEFEQTVEWTEEAYAQLRKMEPWSVRSRVLLAVVGFIGVLALLSRWTAPLGVLLVLSTVFFWFTPRIGRRATKEEFERASYLREPVTYGVTDTRIWMRGGPLQAESRWNGLRVWDRRGGWFLLAASGMPPVYLAEDKLIAAGVLEPILILAQKYGVEFDAASRAKNRDRRLTRS